MNVLGHLVDREPVLHGERDGEISSDALGRDDDAAEDRAVALAAEELDEAVA